MTSPRPTSKIFTIKKEVILINFFVVGAIFASVFTRYDSFRILFKLIGNCLEDILLLRVSLN